MTFAIMSMSKVHELGSHDHEHEREPRAGNLRDHEYEPAHDTRERVHELSKICGDPNFEKPILNSLLLS